jgi:ATP-dependent RNA helicase SUPV3L1/SUV3
LLLLVSQFNFCRNLDVGLAGWSGGKTHAAINALANAESGVYGGPLRLLAWEIYERLTARGVACDLLTGQEVIRVPGAKHYSSTMELCQLSRPVQV